MKRFAIGAHTTNWDSWEASLTPEQLAATKKFSNRPHHCRKTVLSKLADMVLAGIPLPADVDAVEVPAQWG